MIVVILSSNKRHPLDIRLYGAKSIDYFLHGQEELDQVCRTAHATGRLLRAKARWLATGGDPGYQQGRWTLPSASLQMALGPQTRRTSNRQSYPSLYKVHRHSHGHRGRWVYYGDYKVYVPSDKVQAEVFFVHPSVSVWALLVLRSEGWQLIRDRPVDHQASILPPTVRTNVHARLRTARVSSMGRPRKTEEEIYEPEP